MAVEEKMNVTRALAELKRITKTIEEMVATKSKYVAIAVGQGNAKKAVNSSLSLEKIDEIIRANVQKIDTLFARRSAIKRAVVLSNATTKIKFLGKEITVAEAIEYRSQITPSRVFLNDMVNEYISVSKVVEENNAKLKMRIDNQVMEATKNLVNAPDLESALKTIRESITNAQLETNEYSLIDPCNIEDRIRKQREEIDAIDTELDYILNESNAVTQIEFSY